MIIYQATKAELLNDVGCNRLASTLTDTLSAKLKRPARNEIRSWENSLQFMHMVMGDRDIPDDSGVAIEYIIPTSSKRIDFLLTGYDENANPSAVIIELKQWEEAKLVQNQEDMVTTYVGNALRTVPHPSYQAWSYASLLEGFVSSVQDDNINLHPCAFLHNYRSLPGNDDIRHERYQPIMDKAPLFDRDEVLKLIAFIKQNVRIGDRKKVLYQIEFGKIRPSKSLQDSLENMLQGNKEFVMIDEQKTVYEQALALAEQSQHSGKHVFIVEGGPGTGKTVVAVNLLVEATKRNLVAQYISKNSAPRDVYKVKLKQSMKANAIDNLFKGSGGFVDMKENTIDFAIVDEAHRLNEFSGFYSNSGENQIKEIIQASKCSVFFIDEDQIISIKDIGSVSEIEEHARNLGATIHYDELSSQFRCNGSDGYLAWLDHILQIRETANYSFDIDFDFDIVDTPQELLQWVKQKNLENNKARVMAGYCWEWPTQGRDDPDSMHITIPEHDFSMTWNLAGQIWAIDDSSVDQAGCIHTSQGLEFDYIGVIIGLDMRYEDGEIVTDFRQRANTDASLRGIKTMAERSPEKAKAVADRIIKNTYRTLMTRGMKGCRVFCENPNLANYLRTKLRTERYSWEQERNVLVADEAVDYQINVGE